VRPVPWRPADSRLIALALFLIAGALLQWSGRVRLGCAFAAIGIVMFVLLTRLRQYTRVTRDDGISMNQRRVDRIRAERDARMGRRR